MSTVLSSAILKEIRLKGRRKLLTVSETQLMIKLRKSCFVKELFNGNYFYELAILSDLLVTFRLTFCWLLVGSWHHLVCF